MTAIAYRNGVMAADSLICFGDTKTYDPNKVRLVKGHLIGISGEDCPDLKAFDRWYFRKSKRLDAFGGEFTALVVTPKMEVLLVESDGSVHPLKQEFWAIGAGADICLGAMDTGANAARAVQAAIKWNSKCAGRVQQVRFPR